MRWPDRTLDLLIHGYPTLGSLRRSGGKEAGVVVPLLGRPSLCVGGPAGVRLFYDETLTTRQGALPAPVRSVLFGDGAVHGLDGDAHAQRKAMFLSLLGEQQARELTAVADRRWAEAIAGWVGRGEPISVFERSVEVLGAAVCEWAGVPRGRAGPAQYRDLAAIVDGFGSVGPRHLAARRSRRRADRWAAEVVDDVRGGRITPPEGTALAVIAAWAERDGSRLELPVAAVELLNVLRPATAVAWFVTFAALALDDEPGWRDRLCDGDPDAGSAFAHEVRRLYPFAPLLAARARTAFDWHGHTVPAGRRIVLDIYGTLHDETLWPEPDRFAPDRFAGAAAAAAFSDAYIPHGGGDPADGHRCPGEAATLALLEGAARRLAALRYQVVRRGPVDLARMPPRPEVVITDVEIA